MIKRVVLVCRDRHNGVVFHVFPETVDDAKASEDACRQVFGGWVDYVINEEGVGEA